MNITIFGVVYLFILILSFFYKNIKPMIVLLFFSFVLQCDNVLIFNGTGIGPAIFSCLAFIIRSFINNPSISKLQHIDFFFLIFIIYIFINSFLINSNYDFSIVLKMILLFLYFISYIRLKEIRFYDKAFFEKLINYLFAFLLIIGLIQFFISLGVLPKFQLFQIFLYNDKSNNIGFYTDNYHRLFSTFMEPSYMSIVLIFGFIYFFNKKFNRKNIFFLLLIVLELVLTFSTTAYLGLAIYLLYKFIFEEKNSKNFILFILTCVFIVTIGLTTNVLDTVIFSKASSGSAGTRNIWNSNALELFKSNLLFGVGYKQSRASSLIYTLASELGIMGIILYSLFVISFILDIIKHRKEKPTFQIAIVISILCCLIALPDIDLVSFWLILFFYALNENLQIAKQLNKIKSEKFNLYENPAIKFSYYK